MDWNYVWKTLLALLVGSGLIGTITTLVVKQIIGQFFNKRLEAYKLELQYKSQDYKLGLDKELESHRSDLNLLYTKASKLHERRLDIIASLFSKLTLLNVRMRIMTAEWKRITGNEEQDKKDEKQRISEASDAYNDFLDFFDTNRIYFSVALCNKITEARNKYFNSLWDYDYSEKQNIGDLRFASELKRKAAKEVQEIIPPILSEIENEFRAIIGVEQ